MSVNSRLWQTMADPNPDPPQAQELTQCTRCKKKFFLDGFSVTRLGRRLHTCKECQDRAKGTRVYDAFVKGLATKHGLTLNDLNEYAYAGGNTGSHHKYFRLLHPKDEAPEIVSTCVCGHAIVENCYIRNGEGRMLTLGNCCIKLFVPTSGRSCEDCGASHRNRKDNRCKNCRQRAPMRTVLVTPKTA